MTGRVVDVVEGLDLSELVRAYAGRGSDAYHPATLLSLLTTVSGPRSNCA
jgi:transposase